MTASTLPHLKVAIAGQGRSGYSIHARALTRLCHHDYRVVAVADQLPDRRRDAEAEFGAAAFADYRELLKRGGFDLFVNALPTPLHVPATVEALEAGFHVVCEKPMAPTVREFDRMARAARRCKRRLFPFQNNRFQPFFDKIQAVVRSGVLGEILVIRSNWSGFRRRWDWQTLTRNLGGSLFNTGPHAIDQALALIGFDKTPRVFCRMACRHTLGGDAEDLCLLTLYGPGLPTVEIQISSYLAYSQGDFYNIQGTLGGLTGHATELRWKSYDPKQAPRQAFWTPWSVNRAYPAEELPWVEEHWSGKIDAENASGYTLRSSPSGVHRFYNNIRDVLRAGIEPEITLSQARLQVAILEEAHRQNPDIWPAFARRRAAR